MNTKIVFNTEPELKSRKYFIKSISEISSRIPGIVFFIFIILKNPFIACTNSNSSFYNKILNDFDTTSYFIAADIKSPFYKGRIIIENNNLYLYLYKTKGYDKGKYISSEKNIKAS
jgi:hypothetical protein